MLLLFLVNEKHIGPSWWRKTAVWCLFVLCSCSVISLSMWCRAISNRALVKRRDEQEAPGCQETQPLQRNKCVSQETPEGLLYFPNIAERCDFLTTRWIPLLSSWNALFFVFDLFACVLYVFVFVFGLCLFHGLLVLLSSHVTSNSIVPVESWHRAASSLIGSGGRNGPARQWWFAEPLVAFGCPSPSSVRLLSPSSSSLSLLSSFVNCQQSNCGN